jgi:hypothetical protein
MIAPYMCRPEFWAVGISKPELSKDLRSRSRGDGDNFQSPMGVAPVVVRHRVIASSLYASYYFHLTYGVLPLP